MISEVLRHVAPTHPKVQTDADQLRMGLYRAQGVLEHPILWGVFCSLAISNAFFIYREKFAKSVVLTGFATAMTFTSLSSGPLLAAAIQLGMIGWGWITRNAWWVLISLVVLGYVVIDLISNRTPIQVLITYLTFNSGSAYWRLHIWTYGSQEVWRHPLIGIGLNDWVRPDWMGTASVDNFWLLTTMRYGLPAFLFLVGGIDANLFNIIRADLSERLKDIRRGYVIATIGLAMTLCTVHAWGSAIVFVMFYFGAGSWFFTGATPAGTPEPGRAAWRRPAAEPDVAAGDAGAGRRARQPGRTTEGRTAGTPARTIFRPQSQRGAKIPQQRPDRLGQSRT